MISLIYVLIYVVLGGALSFEVVNFVLLIKLRNWSQTAGKNLISQVIKALNIKSNALYNSDGQKGETIKNSIEELANSEAVQPILQSLTKETEESDPGIDIGGIIQGLMTGEITKADLAQYAPLIIKFLKNKPQNQNQPPVNGHW